MNLKDYSSVERWFNEVFSGGIRSASTEKTYIHFLGRYCKFTGKDPDQLIKERTEHLRAIDEIERRQHEDLLKRWRNHMENNDGLARGSVVTASNVIKSFYKANYVPLLIKGPKLWRTRVRKTPTLKELKLMVDKSNIRDKTIIMFLAQSGASLEDFLALVTYDKIKKQLEDGITPLHLPMVRTKIKKQYDTFVGNNTLDFLKEYLEQPKRKPRKTSAVFPYTPRSIQYYLQAASERANLKPYVTPHKLRSFFSTRLKLTECPDTQIEYWMGHTIAYGGAYFVPPIEEQRKLYKEYEWAISISS